MTETPTPTADVASTQTIEALGVERWTLNVENPLSIITGNALDELRHLPDASIQSCVTSPPYWGLRDYKTGKWEGGDSLCDHRKVTDEIRAVAKSTLGGGQKTNGHQQEGFKSVCGRCGAVRIDSQLGLEKTPEEYVHKIVEIFRDVRRVLHHDGTLWLNLGDSYYSGNRGGYHRERAGVKKNLGHAGNFNDFVGAPNRQPQVGLKDKDLVGIPWLVAFALRADGWYLRQDIIWAKPNPMPESVRDRCTKAHEYIFLLTKNPRYFYDADAISEASIFAGDRKIGLGSTKDFDPLRQATLLRGERIVPDERNKRSVWTVTTQPYPEAHFATYPADLIKPCILAGSRPGDTILDPFAGSGTTGLVALELGRKAILIELNPDYAKLIQARTTTTLGLALPT